MITDEQRLEMLETRLQAMLGLVGDARAAVRQDHLVDISSLEHDIGMFCGEITRSDPAIAKQMEPRVLEMIADLELLAEELGDFQGRMKDRIAEKP